MSHSIIFTFADGQNPPAMEMVKKSGLLHTDEAMFKFNNSAIYASRGDESVKFFWNFGYESLRKYFLHLGGITAASLDTTKKVLEKRERLQFYLEHLRQKIDNGMEKLKNIESMTIDVMRLQVHVHTNYFV